MAACQKPPMQSFFVSWAALGLSRTLCLGRGAGRRGGSVGRAARERFSRVDGFRGELRQDKARYVHAGVVVAELRLDLGESWGCGKG